MSTSTPEDSFDQLLRDLNAPLTIGTIGKGPKPPGSDLGGSRWWKDYCALREARLARERASERAENEKVGLVPRERLEP